MRPTPPLHHAQAFLALLLLLFPTARPQLHAGRHALITPTPAAAGLPIVGGLVGRDVAAAESPICAASQTACADGNGCCPDGAACISSGSIGLCASACAVAQPTCLFGGVAACCQASETCGAALCVPAPATAMATTEAGMAPPAGTPTGAPVATTTPPTTKAPASVMLVTKTEAVPVGACAMTETFCSWPGAGFNRGCCAPGYQCVTASAGLCTSGGDDNTSTATAAGLTGAALLSTTTVTLQVATGGVHRPAVGWAVLGAVGVVAGL
jgi:hypothetical protein